MTLRIQTGGRVYLVPASQARYLDRIRNAEGNDGMIQAGATMRLFKGRPDLHRAMTLGEALLAAGFKMEDAQ